MAANGGPGISKVDFVIVFVEDYDTARDFYGGTLGLEQSRDYGFIDGGEFETGSLTLQVLSASSIGREFKPSDHPIALHVDDVAAARAGLESEGVKFAADTMDTGVCHMAFFDDPSGNSLCLHNRYAPPDARPAAAQG